MIFITLQSNELSWQTSKLVLGSFVLECLMGFVPRLPHPSIFLFLTELYIPSSSTDPMTFRPPFHTFLQAPLPLGRFLTSFLWNSCYGMKAEIPGDQLTRGRMENSWNEFLADQAPNAPHLWKKIQNYQCICKIGGWIECPSHRRKQNAKFPCKLYGFQGCIYLPHCVQTRSWVWDFTSKCHQASKVKETLSLYFSWGLTCMGFAGMIQSASSQGGLVPPNKIKHRWGHFASLKQAVLDKLWCL